MITASMDAASVAGFRMKLDEFTKLTGKSVDEGIKLLGKAISKELAIMVPPFGVSAKQGKAFQKSIQKQIDRAVKAANVAGMQGSAESVHERQRREGQVPKDLKTVGKFKRAPIPIGEKIDLIRKKQAAAGRAKGAWIAAGEAIDGKKINGISAWVRKHAKKHGQASVHVAGMGSIVTISNHVQYIAELQSQNMVKQAMRRGYGRNARHMMIVIKKINKEI
jgi:hypothetical protein